MLELVIDQRRKDLGGFEVGRVLPYAKRRMVGPFIFFDHMGPADFAPGLPRSFDVRPHPHIGIATVTYLFSGEIMHRDSLAVEQPIRPGEVNWMVAGKGVTHSERFEKARAKGDHMHGIQAWVALPEAFEETEPSFAHHAGADLPMLESEGASMRLIAGAAHGLTAGVRTFSPMFYAHWTLQPGAAAEIEAGQPERAAYVAAGAVRHEGERYEAGKMLVFAPGETVALTAEEPSFVMTLGGEPIGPRFIEWNFVSSQRERIEQAKADWRAGRIKLPDLDNAEFIPLPEDKPQG